MNVNFRPLIAAVALAAVAACDSRSAPVSQVPDAAGSEASVATPEAGRVLQACDLLSSEDVQQVIGEPVLAPQPAGYECSFRRQPGPDGLRVLVARLRLEISDGSPEELFERYRAAIQSALGTAYDPPRTSDLGDIAAWDGDAVIATVGLDGEQSAFLIVQLTGMDPAIEREWAEALARRAMDRLRARGLTS